MRGLQEVLREKHAMRLGGHPGVLGRRGVPCGVVEQRCFRTERRMLLRRMRMKHAVLLRYCIRPCCCAVLCPAVTCYSSATVASCARVCHVQTCQMHPSACILAHMHIQQVQGGCRGQGIAPGLRLLYA